MKSLLDFAVLIVLYFLIFFKKWRRRGNDVLLVNTLMYIYLSFVLYFTLMPIISALPFILDHSYVPMNMTPFIDVTHGRGDFVRQIALNIIMTVPFGFLLPLTDHKLRSRPSSACAVLLGLLRVLFLTFLLSFTIETLQPLLHSFRSADITDLITNVLGGLLGYLFYLVFRPLLHNLLDLLKKPPQNPPDH